MKLMLLLAAATVSVSALAQPVITSGNAFSAPGFNYPVRVANATSGPGNPGANQTWDFSGLTYASAGSLTTFTLSETPFASSFPSATGADWFGGGYSYYRASASKLELMAASINSPGSGNDLSPNPRTMLKFPFSFGESDTDTWQRVGGPVENVTISYDGYGTLITPSGTYTDVVRIREDYGNNNVDYHWYMTSPLRRVQIYLNSANQIYSISGQPNGRNDNLSLINAQLYPNPASGRMVLEVAEVNQSAPMQMHINTVTGQHLKTVAVTSAQTEIDLSNMAGGIYFYQVVGGNRLLKAGKFVVE